jgi:hypothetical protein
MGQIRGYKKTRDQIVYLGYKISTSSVKNILIENGYLGNANGQFDFNTHADKRIC